MLDPENAPDDTPPIRSTPEFQDAVAQDLADFNSCIAKREEYREQLQRTKDILDGMTVDESLNDRGAVTYLLHQGQSLADIALMLHDDRIDELETKRDELAKIIQEN